MNSEYLWDRSGEPDPEIQQLEAALAKFRHQGEPPVLPETRKSVRKSPFSVLRRPRLVALAASIILIAVFGIARSLLRQTEPVSISWDVARLTGSPRVGSQEMGEASRTQLAVGQTLETDGDSRATINANSLGQISVEPNTRLRLLSTRPGRQRLALDRGTIHATIWASPGQFVVDTPSARAIDLGCAYTLHVDDSGAGLLQTTMGWVGFKLADREAFIPAGAVCATRPKIGPGTPYFQDASESFRGALSAVDFAALTPKQRTAKLELIIGQARRKDALTLWHLLLRVDREGREHIYEHLKALVPPPKNATREGILRLDQPMLDGWWSELGYGDISLWRKFERSWSQSEPRVE
jgi:hypothetical protein